MKDVGLLARLLRFALAHWPLYLVALVLAPVPAAVSLLQPLLVRLAIDDGIVAQDAAALRFAALAYLGTVIVGFIGEAVYSLGLTAAATRTIADIRSAVVTRLYRLPQRWHDHEPAGRALTRATSDVDALGETITAGAFTIALDVLQIIAMVGLMLWLDPWLTATLSIVAPPLIVAIEVIRRILRKLYLEVRNALSAVNAFLAERLNGVEVIQLFSDEPRAEEQARRLLAVHNDAAVKTNFWDALMYAIIDGLSSVCIALMLWYAAGGWIEATVATPGLFAAFLDAVARLFRPIQEFSAKIAILQRATTSLEKITGLLDEPIADRSGTQTVPAERVDLELRDLTFAYDKDHPVLHGISLKVGHGETVALVGRTGSGKSTIGKLATRTYDGWEGLLSAGGVAVGDWDLDALRQTIGQVRQDVQLFSGSVRFNLSLGRGVDDESLNRAIDQARARRVVDRLGGLDGLVEGNGGNVSSGEAQLLSLARTLVQDPPFVVLDEATASVDSLTEAAIQEATAELLSRKTVLVVAHRLSTVVGAHRIVVLDQGRIIEQGAHPELIAADGPYSRLFREQFEERAH